jgi:hypothetical protein
VGAARLPEFPAHRCFAGFPMIGKKFPDFSSDWKKVFQWLEKTGGIFQ